MPIKKVPVTPYVAGGNIGGLTIPLKGGISLDLKRMNRIIVVNETDMYAVIEPGVTFGHIKAYLEKYHPNLVYTYAFSPPSAGIIPNALLQGLDTLPIGMEPPQAGLAGWKWSCPQES